MIKHKFIPWFFLMILTSCSALKKSTKIKSTYPAGWISTVNDAVETDVTNLPTCEDIIWMGERCKEQIKLINLETNKKILDSLVTVTKNCSGFVIIDRYLQGFEYRHSTSYLVLDKFKLNCRGTQYAWFDPDPLDTDSSIPTIVRHIHLKYKVIEKHLKLGRECNTDCVYIITFLDKNFNIKKCVVKISPDKVL